jgi:DNA-binding XRE family transcriptional regulator
MGVLEIIAEKSLGAQVLNAHPKIRASFHRVENNALGSKAGAVEKARIANIVELCFEYEREVDPDEKANILRTLEEVIADEPLELPTGTIEDWEAGLKTDDSKYAKADRTATRQTEAFLKKYFSLRAKAGLSTQADVAKASGLKRGYIAVIETGEHHPQQKTLQKLAKAFRVDVTELLR